MLFLGIIMIVLGLMWGSWSFKNNQRPPHARPMAFNTQLSGCMMNFIPLALIIGGIYILMTH